MRSVSELLRLIESTTAELAVRLQVDDACSTDDTGLHDTVMSLQRVSSSLAVVSAHALSAWDRRRVWAGCGHTSAAHRLANEAHRSVSNARRDLRRARQLSQMPATATAILDGRLSIDHVDLLARADRPWRHLHFADHEQTLVDHCATLRWEPACRVVDYWIQHADAVAAEHDERIRALDVHCWASSTLDGAVVVDAVLDPIGGTIVATELDRLERQLWLADQAAGNERSPRQRRAAALVEMATRSASTPSDAQRPRPLFTVLVGDDTARHLCELASSRTVLHPSALGAHLDTALVESVIFDGPLTVLGVSDRRSFTGSLRRAIEVRDRNCRHESGCDVPADRCDVDHIDTWAEGGSTHQFNGRLLCRPHNRHSDLRGVATTPPSMRHLHRLDLVRARLRWRVLRAADESPGP